MLPIATLVCFSSVWTEPLFIFLMISSIYFLSCFIGNGKLFHFFLAAILASGASLCRYAGASLIAACAFSVLLLPDSPISSRMRLASRFFLGAILIPCLWISRAIQISGFHRSIHLGFHLPSSSHFRGLARALLGFVLPEKMLEIVRDQAAIQILALLLAAIAILAACHFLFKRFDPWESFAKMGAGCKAYAVFAVSYAMFILLSISIFDFSTPMDMRMISPLIPAFTVFLPRYLMSLRERREATPPVGARKLVLAFSLFLLVNAVLWVLDFSRNGAGYSSWKWCTSGLVEFARGYPGIIYSNDRDAIYFLTGRLVKSIPNIKSRYHRGENQSFHGEFEEMKFDLLDNGGLIVYFNSISGRETPSQPQLKREVPPREIIEFPEGAALAY